MYQKKRISFKNSFLYNKSFNSTTTDMIHPIPSILQLLLSLLPYDSRSMRSVQCSSHSRSFFDYLRSRWHLSIEDDCLIPADVVLFRFEMFSSITRVICRWAAATSTNKFDDQLRISFFVYLTSLIIRDFSLVFLLPMITAVDSNKCGHNSHRKSKQRTYSVAKCIFISKSIVNCSIVLFMICCKWNN